MATVAVAPIRAAGGVVWRLSGDGVEVLLVHRPRFDDWSLPKGKAKRGEHAIATAVREVLEETGVRGCPGPRLPSTSYDVVVGEARTGKVVDFWAMRESAEEGFVPGAEVDRRLWAPIESAPRRLTYPRDREVLRALAALRPPFHAPVVVLRHARAGRRWPLNDADRPLTAEGFDQARALARLLAVFAPVRLISATPLRCRQTLAGLAESLRRPVEVEPAFDEGADPHAAAARVAAIAGSTAAVICSQGKLIEASLGAVAGVASPVEAQSRFHTPKGSGWVVTFGQPGPGAGAGEGERLIAIDPLG